MACIVASDVFGDMAVRKCGGSLVGAGDERDNILFGYTSFPTNPLAVESNSVRRLISNEIFRCVMTIF